MNPITLQSVVRRGGLFLALALPVLLAGCSSIAYNDPNVPAGDRYFNTAGAHPVNAPAAQPVLPTAVQPGNPAPSPVGIQTLTPVGAQAANPASAQPALAQVVTNVVPTNGMPTSSKLGVGDLLTINFSDVPPGSLPDEREHRIGDDGVITLPFNVQIHAVGKTPTQLQKEIRNSYVPQWFVNLTVVVKAKDRYVYVDGEVKAPSRQFHLDGLTVLRAISTAGGFTDFANKKKIEVRRAIGGKVEYIDWNKARKDPRLDLTLYVNDQVYVPRGIAGF